MNETKIPISTIDLNKGIGYISSLSQSITGFIVNYLSEKGINVSVRWTSLLLLFISLSLIWLSLKITKPIIKYLLILISILLLIGLIVPSW